MHQFRLFRYSRWDLALLAVIPMQLFFFFGFAALYDRLPWIVLLALVPVCFAMALLNTGASHNHYHTPIFRNKWLNRLASMGFSFSGGPKTPLNPGHGLHHRRPEPWNEQSLLGLLGLRRPLHHQLLGFISYYVESFGVKYLALLWLLRRWPVERVVALVVGTDSEIADVTTGALRDPETLLGAKLDIAAWVIFRLALCLLNFKFFVFYFVPVSFMVQAIRGSDNFFQHWGATDPSDPQRDAVSCYGTVYNLLTFNLGYHQEHHYRPGVHWLKLPRTRRELPADRRIVPVWHYINMPVFYPRLAARIAAERTATTSCASTGTEPQPINKA